MKLKTALTTFFCVIMLMALEDARIVQAAEQPPKININTATEEELQDLPGVGKETARLIIASRPFKAADDLSKVGLSAQRIAKIAPLVTVIDNRLDAGSLFFSGRNGQGRREMVKTYGGSRATENSVDSALRWLAYHQEPDGHWDAMKYSAGEKTDTAVTAFALLALLGAGHTEKVGEYKDNVKRAVAWMKSKQAESGLIWDSTDAGGHRAEGYPGAIASLAIIEAAAMANVPETRLAAQRAVDYCTEVHQAGDGNERSGWRYHPKMEADTSVSGWFIMALKSATAAGLKVNPTSLIGAKKYLDSVEHKLNVDKPGQRPVSNYWYTIREAHEPHRLNAIGCVCRRYLGSTSVELQPTVNGFVATGGLPTWGANGGSVDLYYWYYGTLSVFQQGGDVWNKWNDSMKLALLPNQRRDGDDSGSWDPVGAYAPEWGRVGQTALAALCLEVYYRYARLEDSSVPQK